MLETEPLSVESYAEGMFARNGREVMVQQAGPLDVALVTANGDRREVVLAGAKAVGILRDATDNYRC